MRIRTIHSNPMGDVINHIAHASGVIVEDDYGNMVELRIINGQLQCTDIRTVETPQQNNLKSSIPKLEK